MTKLTKCWPNSGQCRHDLLVLCLFGLRSDLKRPREKYLSSAAMDVQKHNERLIHAKHNQVINEKVICIDSGRHT